MSRGNGQQPAGAQAGTSGAGSFTPPGEPSVNSRTTAIQGEENSAYLENEVIKISSKKLPKCQEKDFVESLVSGRLLHPRLDG